MAHGDHIERDLARYEGLIFSTARLVVGSVELELDDIQQRLRIKAWRALRGFDPVRCRTNVDKWVFMCVRDEVKDIVKMVRRDELYIEDLAAREETNGMRSSFRSDDFDGRYLAANHDDVYGDVEDPGVLVPNTLSALELQVVCLLYAAYRQTEIAGRLGVSKRDMERIMRSIRAKLADWQPTNPTAEAVQLAIEVLPDEPREPLAA